jgi:hypothetical protein
LALALEEMPPRPAGAAWPGKESAVLDIDSCQHEGGWDVVHEVFQLIGGLLVVAGA